MNSKVFRHLQKNPLTKQNIFSILFCLSIKQTQSATEQQSTSFPSALKFHVHIIPKRHTTTTIKKKKKNLRNAHIKEFNYIFIDHKFRDEYKHHILSSPKKSDFVHQKSKQKQVMN